ncbi:5-formyltetrahydrofolate cyclo-ligase [Alphaproteobacteria bacterium]|nr:5-formyltetrahydrofolate cyclo-ligase [Alphaproteobacteria bacterium]
MINSGEETDKAVLRRVALRARKAASLRFGAKAGEMLADAFPEELIFPDMCVAGFWAINDEIDPKILMQRLEGRGCVLCLPVVAARNRPLRFLRWKTNEDLVLGPYRTMQPPPSAEVAEPDLIIIPMVAFDERGYRLGYGGGYYDRTLEVLREKREVTAVGIAFSAQRMEEAPAEEFDQPVDWIVTEKGATKVTK